MMDWCWGGLMVRRFSTAASVFLWLYHCPTPLLLYRRFAKSGKFSGVVAADFSETMLQQARSYFKEDGTLGGSTPIALLRADVARLPFATGSLAAIHAGGDVWGCVGIRGMVWGYEAWCGDVRHGVGIRGDVPPLKRAYFWLDNVPFIGPLVSTCPMPPCRCRYPLLAQPPGSTGRDQPGAEARRRLCGLDLHGCLGAARAGHRQRRPRETPQPGGWVFAWRYWRGAFLVGEL